MSNGDSLFETSVRDQERTKKFAERNARIAKLKTKPMSVREMLDSGQEHRLYTSAPGHAADADDADLVTDATRRGSTRAINPNEATDDASVTEIGRVLYVQEEVKEAEAARRQPLPAYAEPTDPLDPRAHPNVDDLYANDPNFRRWLENDAPPEKVAKIAQIATEQRQNQFELAELTRLVPTWQQDIEPMLAWLKATQGTTDQDVRQFMRNPQARLFAQWHERWLHARYNASAARAKKSGHLEDVGNQISEMMADAPGPVARQRDEDAAAMADGLMGKLRNTYVPGREIPGERGASISAAGDYFAHTLDLGLPDDGALEEEATDRSLMG